MEKRPLESEGQMDAQTGEETPQPEESRISSSEQVPSTEEPIILKTLYPHAKQDLDALFPEPNMKKLLQELVKTRQKNDRFLKRIKLITVDLEEENESEGSP
jgi:hypothetical protein